MAELEVYFRPPAAMTTSQHPAILFREEGGHQDVQGVPPPLNQLDAAVASPSPPQRLKGELQVQYMQLPPQLALVQIGVWV